MQNCSCCFEDWIGPCNGPYEYVTINTKLNSGVTYNWRITDKFGKIYQGTTESTIDGTVQIPCSDLPDFLFTPYSGDFLIELLDEGCKPINFPITMDYDCIRMSINGGNANKHSIGCAQDIGGGEANAMIPFDGVSGLQIYYPTYANLLGKYPTIQVYQQHPDLPTGNYIRIFPLIEFSHDTLDLITDINITFEGITTGYVLMTY